MIDYARVFLLNQQTENVVKKSVKSVLSAYDTKLQEDFGLFGTGHYENQDIFKEVIDKNLKTSQGYFNLLNPKLVEHSSTLKSDYFLGNTKILKQQILEEMKYKAPIEFTMEFVDRFGLLSKEMQRTFLIQQKYLRI